MRLNKSIKKLEYFIIIGFFLISFVSLLSTVSADPTVNNIITNPSNPKPLSSVTVIANISGENITNVALTVSECSDETGLCYVNPVLNENMTLNSNGNYEKEFTLKDADGRTDHIEYRFTVNDNGEEYILDDDSFKTYLDLSSNENGDGGNGQDNGSGDTPGFELVLIFLAIIIGVIYYKKKR